MPKKKETGEKHFKFASPAFLHNGQEYKSKEVEAAVANGEEWAEELLLELVKVGQVVEMTAEEAAAEEQKLAAEKKAANELEELKLANKSLNEQLAAKEAQCAALADELAQLKASLGGGK
ncbi:MAG: hypothetical protein O9340_04410 [Cyclobacteriaceae bacterium]|nr:hypothetical protein [Cyclobacteriaceae bacterium]